MKQKAFPPSFSSSGVISNNLNMFNFYEQNLALQHLLGQREDLFIEMNLSKSSLLIWRYMTHSGRSLSTVGDLFHVWILTISTLRTL